MYLHVIYHVIALAMDDEDDRDELYAGLDAFVGFAESVIEHVCLLYHNCDLDTFNDLVELAEQVLQFTVLLGDVIGDEVIAIFRELVSAMTAERERRNTHTRGRGRPEIAIGEQQLCFLIEEGFRIQDIADMFGCCRRTVERKMNRYHISVHNYSSISDSDLDMMIQEMTTLFPQSGEKTISGQLRSRGVRVQRQRVRESLHRVDPSGVRARCRNVLHRRQYSVPSPNALWHIDGYHKLIRWRLVIHGAIDGYSRLIMFLKVSPNNQAETVLDAFVQGVEEFGLPSRVRMDRGGENVLVARYMIEHPERGPGRGSAITGRSTHNQRIERLWKDLFSGCVSFFYSLFHSLEDIQELDVNCPFDVYALHFVFKPIIQHHLDSFRQGWAHHSLRTERSRTPQQLWISGLHNSRELDPDNPAITGLNVSLMTVLLVACSTLFLFR